MCSFAALLAAARRAARGKKRRSEVARFLWNLEAEVIALQAELSTGVWRPGPSRRFVIHDPKEREITAAPFRDRVVHHAVCAAVGPVLERAAIEHSYACRPGKGVHAAVRQCQRFCQSGRYFLKCDVRGFYSSVDHAVLMRLLRRVVKDRPMLDLLGLIVDTGGVSGGGGAGGTGGRGLPIGNLTSQYFANFILTGLDLFVLQELRPGGYVRYMDDFALFDDDRTRLRAMLGRIRAYLREERGLELKEPATLLTRTAVGVPFLGLRVFPGTLRLRRRKIRRCRDLARRRIAEYLAGERDEASLQASLGSIVAHVEMGGSPGLRRAILVGE
jgi:hypothetical protein